jgi:hypothetical protein
MSTKTSFLAVAAIVTGLAGGLAAYQIAAPDSRAEAETSPAVASVTSEGGRAEQGKTQGRQRLAPCRPPAQQEGRKCVTDVRRTVVLPGPVVGPAQGAPPPVVVPPPVVPVPVQSIPNAPLPAVPVTPPPAAVSTYHDGDDDHDHDDDGHRHSGEGEAGHHGDDSDELSDVLEDFSDDRADAREDRLDEARDAEEDRLDDARDD